MLSASQLKSLPKIELHLHLDCSLSYAAVSALVPTVTHEEYKSDYMAPARCTDLTEFLSRAHKGFRLMQSEMSLRLVTGDLFRQLIDDGVIYAELRFAPLLHLEQGLTPEQVVSIVDRSTEDFIRQTGLEARLILCTLRHFNEEQSMQTAKLVEQFRGSRVVALDIAGDEAGFPLDAHVSAYRYAHERGLQCTAHAGEALGPESVWETLRLLKPSRIGHGTRSIEDSVLVEHLREHRIHLEICPSSNVQIIPSIEAWEHHPVDKLFRAGVPLNINTDTRMLTPATLTGEYHGLQETFDWSAQDLLDANLLGVHAAFAEQDVKAKLRRQLADSFKETLPDAAGGRLRAELQAPQDNKSERPKL
ncbi:MAG TPA: adenosine deaminase [Candidatus Baltobacteraceae bacterium]|nr:adenosine deaminase [Candidatus Baltobacteraceae bacterium]